MRRKKTKKNKSSGGSQRASKPRKSMSSDEDLTLAEFEMLLEKLSTGQTLDVAGFTGPCAVPGTAACTVTVACTITGACVTIATTYTC